MPKKINGTPKRIDPKEKRVGHPDDQEARKPDDRHPCRDTRESPSPNPNGEPVDSHWRQPAAATESRGGGGRR
jgi:hypothetical protein